ncbi:DUF3618 domain-containing protein [Demetria terragena]|uniref:DUF3618 domain-containing protein n=1 Tax=Demetria terragena TaxID=63959 RepID=UPI000361D77A|nr:DUF3618 domain-containing protein [Demetria terragena]
MAEQRAKTAKEIEADLAASRNRLASTIDELAFRAQPKELVKRQTEDVKLKVHDATHTPDGEFDSKKVGTIAGGVLAAVVLIALIRRARG